jgi:hypothetical protein
MTPAIFFSESAVHSISGGSGRWGWENFSLKFPVKILRNFQEILYNLARSGNTEQNKKAWLERIFNKKCPIKRKSRNRDSRVLPGKSQTMFFKQLYWQTVLIIDFCL